MKIVRKQLYISELFNKFFSVFGKNHVVNKGRVSDLSKNQIQNLFDQGEIDRRISITKSEDFYKAQQINYLDPFIGMNR